ncbi:MAG: GNAT family N-acetyltransferase [Chloroflexota bacterium]
MDHIEHYWHDRDSPLDWTCVFTLPPWLGAWWSAFGQAHALHLCVARQEGSVIGIGPLMVTRDRASVIGSGDLTDYTDFIVAPGRGSDFFLALLKHLRQEGVSLLRLGRTRADSETLVQLKTLAGSLGFRLSCKPADVLYEMALPDSWEAYLDLLSGKERHEIRRKLRRLSNAGRITIRVVEERGAASTAMDAFITLFRSNLREKALFMTHATEHFFRSLADRMAESGILRLHFLDLDSVPVAATMCIDYQSTVYLYNNGYDDRYRHLSVGLLSKVLSIKESILRGRRRFNFLRGGEAYKQRLGGSPVLLLECEVLLR